MYGMESNEMEWTLMRQIKREKSSVHCTLYIVHNNKQHGQTWKHTHKYRENRRTEIVTRVYDIYYSLHSTVYSESN